MKVNDIVRFLNEVGGGRIVRIDGNTAYVEDGDGFERPVLTRDIVVEETPTGEQLNVVLAYEPKEIKHLSTTTFYATLVNDSNYFLYVTYATRSNEMNGWVTRFHGIVEPNMQVTMDEFGHDDLTEMDRLAVQYVAFKQGKEYKLKNPALVEQKLDTTKFYKLHCFHENEYFDSPVLAIEIVHNDLPAKALTIDSSALEKALREKKREDRPRPRAVERRHEKNDITVVDLHIHELVDTTAGLDSASMLAIQMDKFREVMKANQKNLGHKIVFIHGKGEGVLRKAILDELRRRYPRCAVQDASFQEYGFGATQVTIHQ